MIPTFFQNLNPSDTKCFWKTIIVLNKLNACGSSLTHNGIPCSSDSDKASSLNEYFSRCFNTSYQPISTTTPSSTEGHECVPEVLCTEDEVCVLLNSLDTSKASGPDGISARMLKATAVAIATSVTKLLNLSISSCCPPSSWKISSVVPIPKVPKANSTTDYRPILCSLY